LEGRSKSGALVRMKRKKKEKTKRGPPLLQFSWKRGERRKIGKRGHLAVMAQ